MNIPLPRGTGDDGFALVRDAVILPQVQGFHPQAIVLQWGADAVTEDPLARLSLSNNSHWSVVRALMGMAPRLLVLGGGGYNPWSVARLWAGVWAALNGRSVPDVLPEAGQVVMRGLSWHRKIRAMPTEALLTTMQDRPRPGEISASVRDAVRYHQKRAQSWV